LSGKVSTNADLVNARFEVSIEAKRLSIAANSLFVTPVNALQCGSQYTGKIVESRLGSPLRAYLTDSLNFVILDQIDQQLRF
jgi:hypothetical protein